MANEKRLIDANWILGEIEHDLGCYEIGEMTEDDALYVELRDVVKMVCAAPTVDAVEVVRCKDCKHYLEEQHQCEHPTIWAEYCSDFGMGVEPGDFCSYGERRTDV